MTPFLFCFVCFAAISCGASQPNTVSSAEYGCCIGVWICDICRFNDGLEFDCDVTGTTSKCDTDDKVVCDRASTCDWTDDETKCSEQTQPEPNPAPTDFAGCCIGTTDTCNVASDTGDKSLCDRTGTCWWSFDSTTCENSGGCCSGTDIACQRAADVEAQCNRNGNLGCEWIEGKDADCSSSDSSSSERGSSGGKSSGKSSSGKSSGSSSRRSSSSSSDRRGPGSEQSLFADVSVGENKEMSQTDVLLLALFAVTFMIAAHQLYRWCSGSEYKALPEMSQSQPLLGTDI